MIQFARPEFLWALPLIAIPVIIHLINRLRYRRVRFAATRFLMESQHRYKVRVLLREWLLLALRILVFATAIFLFARPQVKSGLWGSELFGRQVHLLLLLDDTLSMQAVDALGGSENTFERAKAALRSLLQQVGAGGGSFRLTLLRFSQARPGQLRADLAGETITPEVTARVEGLVRGFFPSFAAVPGPSALQRALEIAELAPEESMEIVLFSDFPRNDWGSSPQLATIRNRLLERKARLTLVSCRESQRPRNLAVVTLEKTGGICAEGVPVKLRVGIGNYSDRPVRDLPVLIYCESQVLPPVVFPEIPAGQVAFQEFFLVPPRSGELSVTAEIGADGLEADNQRYCVLPVAKAVQVLLADGDPQGIDAQYVETALAPGGLVETGVVCRRVWTGALSAEDLHLWDLVILMNAGRLEPSVLGRLERFVAGGGGLLYFVGEKADPLVFEEQFCRAGQGLLPVTLSPPQDRQATVFLGEGNLRFEDHPALSALKGLTGPLVSSVFVRRYMPMEVKEELSGERTPQFFLRLSDGPPLGILFTFGRGKTAILGTTAGPRWNNWARVSPSYVVTLLELVGYLARTPVGLPPVTIGESPRIALTEGELLASVRYRLPGMEVLSELPPEQLQEGTIQLPAVTTPGFAEVEWELKPGEKRVQLFAGNVDCRESDLRTASPEQLRLAFAGIPIEITTAANLASYSPRTETADLAVPCLGLLLGVLILERALSFLMVRDLSFGRSHGLRETRGIVRLTDRSPKVAAR